MRYEWNPDKNEELKRERNISFEQIVFHLSQGDVQFEPITALSAGSEGLDDIRDIVSLARKHLGKYDWLMVEHGYNQADSVADLFAQAGFEQIVCHSDFASVERITVGKLHLRPL